MTPRTIAILPCSITLGNAVCGFIAIALIAGGDVEHVGRFSMAAWFIFFAMIFDALDGWVARATHSSSALGEQLDSLCDAISFGAAPALLAGRLVKEVIMAGRDPKLIWVFSAIFMACAVLRLARFTVKTQDDATSHEWFEGLPTPGAAGLIAAVTLVFYALVGNEMAVDEVHQLEGLRKSSYLAIVKFLPVLTLVLGVLMMSKIPYPHMFSKLFGGKQPIALFILLLLVVAVFVFYPEYALFGVFGAFSLSGPLIYLYRLSTGKLRSTEQQELF